MRLNLEGIESLAVPIPSKDTLKEFKALKLALDKRIARANKLLLEPKYIIGVFYEIY